MSDAGTWTTTGPACACACPSPTVRVGYSERVNPRNTDGTGGFSDWTPYDYTNRLFASNGGPPETGGVEIQVRGIVEITNTKGVEGVLRWRQIDSQINTDATPSETVYSRGATQVYTLSGAGMDTFEFSLVAPVGWTSAFEGGPARASVDIISETQTAELKMKGFTRYLPDGLTVHILKNESVTSGGDPGCPANSRPARVYTGAHSFTPGIASAATSWIADPAGVFTDTRSPNLIADNHASTPFGHPNQTVEFGTVSYTGLNVKTMAEPYTCGQSQQSKTLALNLSISYTTDDLTGAVDAALDTQQSLGAVVFPAGTNGTCVHRQFLSSDGTFYRRARTQQIRCSADTSLPTIATRGDYLDVHIHCDVLTRSFTLPATVAKTPLVLPARLYAGGYLAGPDGRATHQPDTSAGETDATPFDSPWEIPEFDGKEVLLVNLRVRPHAMLCNVVPIVELPSVIAEGVDGE